VRTRGADETGKRREIHPAAPDIHGSFLPQFGADLTAWRRSMETLLSLEADILCEGHFGVYRTKLHVREYIESYLDEYGL
jgi:hypothetical protein